MLQPGWCWGRRRSKTSEIERNGRYSQVGGWERLGDRGSMLFEVMSLAALGIALILCAGWALVLARVSSTMRALARLPNGHPAPGEEIAQVSAVVAARNEALLIERAVRSLLAQEGVAMQVIAVDDGSDDDTLAILNRMAAADQRLLVLESGRLPRGWVAKNYALEVGQGRASGEYILFTDADVIHGRRAVYNAVRLMREKDLDHLAVHPRLEASTLVEALILPLYFLLGELRFVDKRAVSPHSGVGAGVGAFNLVRAEPYRLRGTHARIRGAVLDDRALGWMMREDDGRGTVVRAVSQVRMRPYRSLRDLYVGMRKGMLAAFGNRASVTFAMGLGLLFAATTPIALLLLGAPIAYVGHVPWAAAPALAALALPVVGLLRARTMVKFEPLAAVLFPLGAVVIAATAIHASVVFSMKGTVEWRGRQYRRHDLKIY